MTASDNFKAIYYGAEYHNIDGTGWPDAVVMENQGSVLDGTYESRMYYPERTCEVIEYNDCGPHAEDCTIVLSCGHRTLGYIPNYCPSCGAKVVN